MKKVLIISEYITPVQGVGAVRWTKLGKYLARGEDCEITVLTDEKDFDHALPDGNWQRFDATLAADKADVAHYHAVPNNAFLRHYYTKKNQKLAAQTNGAPAGGYVQSMVTPKEESWVKRSVRDLAHFTKDIAQMRQVLRYAKRMAWEFDVILSTYGPAWPHLTARALKKLHPETVWLADYRDACWMPKKAALLSDYYKRFAARVTKQAEYRILAGAMLREQLFLPADAPCETITNGFDPDDKKASGALLQSKFTLSYTGVFYGVGLMSYDIGAVFRALKTLEAQGVLTAQSVQVCYAGGDGDRFLAQAERENAAAYAVDRGVLPRSEALALQQSSHALLLSAWNTKEVQGYITAKIFEYMLADKPIVVTMTGDVPGSLLREMTRRGNLGFCYEQATDVQDFPLLVEYLRGLYLQWKQTGTVKNAQNADYVSTFSHPYLAHRVAQVMDKALAARKM